tara:strand:+ start:664 stop:1143 length:480 start_codon:yes stop_codon:yes gene_type:complete
MANQLKKDPWEAYSQKALDPFGNSMLGQKLNQEKEDRLRKQLDENEAYQYWEDFMETGGRQNEEIPNPDILMNQNFNLESVGDVAKGWTSYLKYPTMKGLLAKLGPKALAKTTSYTFGGPAAWAMGLTDAVDYFGYPIYDYIPGGDYLTWRDTSEGEEE